MATLFITGFESGSLSAEPVLGAGAVSASAGTVVIEPTIVRTGAGSLKVTPASGASAYWYADSSGAADFTAGYIRFYCRLTTLPSASRCLYGSEAAAVINLRVKSTGTIELRHGTTLIGTSTTALTDTSRWYCLEIQSISGAQELKIDQVSEVTGAVASTHTISTLFGASDAVAATYTAYFDDVLINDAQYPGAGKVVMLNPISDNARSAQWTGGAGGTTNLFQGVNKRPPVGTATETDTTQIEHAGGAIGNYDANMTSYTTAGIGASDTVNAIQPYIIHGEDVATGTKLLTYSIVSNPAIASGGNFTAGNDVGLLGTFPSNWFATANIVADAPSVTLGTSPVMRVTRPETASRVASICFMGMYVDYSPAGVAAAVSPPPPTIKLAAVMQASNW